MQLTSMNSPICTVLGSQSSRVSVNDPTTSTRNHHMKTNNPPDVTIDLTHEQATFLLDNCLANKRLAMSVIIDISNDKKLNRDQMIKKSQAAVKLNEQFTDIMQLLRRAGAREPE